MKNDHQENGVPRGPLILMVPASNLVAVMSLDWLDGANQAAVSAEMHVGIYLVTRSRNAEKLRRGFDELSRAAFRGRGVEQKQEATRS
jgi:hypothetical protein